MDLHAIKFQEYDHEDNTSLNYLLEESSELQAASITGG